GQGGGDVHGGNVVVLRHLLVRGGREVHLAAPGGGEHRFVGEMDHHHAGGGIRRQQPADDPFHAAAALARGVGGVLVVVHGELHQEQVDRAVGQYVALQSKRAGGGAGGGDPR